MKKVLTSIGAFLAVILPTTLAFAQDGAAAAPGPFAAIGIGVGIGLAVLGGGLAQSRAAAAALEGIARNPNAADKVFVPMLLGLALIESLVLFALAVAYLLQAKAG